MKSTLKKTDQNILQKAPGLGILAVQVSVEPHQNWVIAGIGVNVTTPFFPGDLVGKAKAMNPLGE